MKTRLLIACLAFVTACDKAPKVSDGIISLVQGNVRIEHLSTDGSKQTTQVHLNDKVKIGDTIVTGIDGISIVEISGAQIEIQRNSRFVYETGGNDTLVYLQDGNAWTSVSKRAPNAKFTLRTPTTVAGVRGTKFYTFTEGEMVGVCHCEGQVAMKNLATGKEEVNNGDYLEFFYGAKSVIVTGADIKKIGLADGHAHSELDKSALGKKLSYTPAQYKQLQALIAKKFAALK